MIDRLFRLFDPREGQAVDPEEKLKVAVAVILLEVAHADRSFEPLEARLIDGDLASRFGLTPEEVRELVDRAELKRQESLDLHQFTRQLNRHLSLEEKLQVMEAVWELIYADGELDRYEDALARQLAGLLHLSPRQAADVKVRVLDRIDPDRLRQ
ncbi:MAG: TerB family tellurite resistance protein [Geothermobacteraceae bacterium]